MVKSIFEQVKKFIADRKWQISLLLVVAVIAAVVNVAIPRMVGTKEWQGQDLPSGILPGNEERTVSGGESGFLTYGPYVALEAGNYTVTVHYSADAEGNTVEAFTTQTGQIHVEALSPSDKICQFGLSFPVGITDLEIRVAYSGTGFLSLEKITIVKEHGRFGSNRSIVNGILLLTAGLLFGSLIYAPHSGSGDGKMKESLSAAYREFLQRPGIVSLRKSGNIYIYILLFVITTLRLIWNFLYGFRWPSEFVLSLHAFNYDDGFLPRGFVGTCLKFIFRDHVYDKVFLSLCILAVGLLILFLFIYFSYYFTIKKRDLVGGAVVLWYALSIYSAFQSHEMGYFEQYGYLLLFVMILFFGKIRNRKLFIVLSALFGFLSILISETNAFLICPTIFAICLLRILTNAKSGKETVGDIMLFVLTNIPSGILCFITGTFNATQAQVDNQIAAIRLHNGAFQRLEEIGGYLFNGSRAFNDFSRRLPLIVDNWQLMAYMLVIIFTVSLGLLLMGKAKEAGLFVCVGGMVIFCAWAVGMIAWDGERFKFAQAMAVTFLAMWELRQNNFAGTVKRKDMLYTLAIGTIIMLCIMDYRLGLFDNDTYKTGITEMIETLKNFPALNAR